MSEAQYSINTHSIQLRKLNDKGRHTLRFVWDIVSRTDSPNRLLIETWGGKAAGYAKQFTNDNAVTNYLAKRLANSTNAEDKLKIGMSDNNIVDIKVIGIDTVNVSDADADKSETRLSDHILTLPTAQAVRESLQIEDDSDWHDNACLAREFDAIPAGMVADSDTMVSLMASRIRDKLGAKDWQDSVVALSTFMTPFASDVMTPGEKPPDFKFYDPARLDVAIDAANAADRAPGRVMGPSSKATIEDVLSTDEVILANVEIPITPAEGEVPTKKDYAKWGAWS